MNRFGWFDVGVVAGCSIFLALGGFLLFIGIRNLSRALASEKWPKTPAIVASSQSSTNTSYDSQTRTASTTYAADIVFQYKVGGKDYSSTIRHFGQTGGSGDYSESEVLRFRYATDTPVTVAYNPADPSIAAAEPGFDADALWVPGAGLAFFVPAIMFIVMWFGMSRGNKSGIGVGLGIFAFVFCSIGGAMLAGGLPKLWLAWQSPQWPQTKGVIVYGQIDRNLHNESLVDSEHHYAISRGDRVVYRYQVNGATYFNNIRRLGQMPESNGFDSDVPGLYPLGREVTVLYSPSNPAVSALEPGRAQGAHWLPVAGSAFLAFGLAVFFFGIPALTE